MSDYSSRFLQNLAGNSFNCADAMVCIVCVLSGLAIADEGEASARLVAFSFHPDVDTDSDGELD